MRILILILSTFISFNTISQIKFNVELFCPKSSMSLVLNDSNFELIKVYTERGYDVPRNILVQTGKFYFNGDTLLLVSNILISKTHKIFKLIKEAPEIYKSIIVDSVQLGQKFMIYTTYYNSRQPQKSGGWTSDGKRNGKWAYWDSLGKLTNVKTFKNGKLVKDKRKHTVQNKIQINGVE